MAIQLLKYLISKMNGFIPVFQEDSGEVFHPRITVYGFFHYYVCVNHSTVKKLFNHEPVGQQELLIAK